MIDTSFNANEDALARIDRQLAQLEDRAERVFGAPGKVGIFNAAVPELSGFSRLFEQQLGGALDKLIVRGAGFNAVMQGVRDSLFSVATQLGVINPLVNALFGSTRTTFADVPAGGGFLTSLANGITSLFGGAGNARALGGPVEPGRAYLVGEQGPEVFVPQAAGSIGRSAASGGVNISVNIATPNPQSFAASSGQISALLLDAVRRGQRLR